MTKRCQIKPNKPCFNSSLLIFKMSPNPSKRICITTRSSKVSLSMMFVGHWRMLKFAFMGKIRKWKKKVKFQAWKFSAFNWFQCFCFFFSWFHCILLLQFTLFLVFSVWIGLIHLGFMGFLVFLELFQCFSTKAIFMSEIYKAESSRIWHLESRKFGTLE